MMPLKQSQIDWLMSKGVTTDAMVRPSAILWDGNGALYFQEDCAFWNVKTGQVICNEWCLGDDLGDYDFMVPDWTLTIHESPLEWLRAGRTGIVVIDWTNLFDGLRDIPSISVPASLKDKYARYMKPARLPRLEVRP